MVSPNSRKRVGFLRVEARDGQPRQPAVCAGVALEVLDDLGERIALGWPGRPTRDEDHQTGAGGSHDVSQEQLGRLIRPLHVIEHEQEHMLGRRGSQQSKDGLKQLVALKRLLLRYPSPFSRRDHQGPQLGHQTGELDELSGPARPELVHSFGPAGNELA